MTAVVYHSLFFTFVRSPLHVFIPCYSAPRDRKIPQLHSPAHCLYQVHIHWPGGFAVYEAAHRCAVHRYWHKILRGGTSTIRNRVSETRPATISIYDDPQLSLSRVLHFFVQVCNLPWFCLFALFLDQIKIIYLSPLRVVSSITIANYPAFPLTAIHAVVSDRS